MVFAGLGFTIIYNGTIGDLGNWVTKMGFVGRPGQVGVIRGVSTNIFIVWFVGVFFAQVNGYEIACVVTGQC